MALLIVHDPVSETVFQFGIWYDIGMTAELDEDGWFSLLLTPGKPGVTH